MPGVMELLAENLKKNRRKCGFSQEKLAEAAGVSTHYVSMIEIKRSFPKSKVIERLAAALNIEVHELFLAPQAPANELEKLRLSIISDMKEIISESVITSVATAVEQAFDKKGKEKIKGKK